MTSPAPADSLDDLFPPPLSISKSFLLKRYIGGGIALLGGLALGLVFIGWQAQDLGRLQRETELYEAATSVPAEDVEVEGEVTTQYFFATYKLNVAYTDKAGTRHTSKVEFDTVPELDKTNFHAVHYDPVDPSRFALNLAVKERGKRLASIAIFMIGGTLLVGGSFAFLGYAAMRTARSWRRISRNGRVVLCAPVKAVAQKQYGRVVSTTYHFQVPGGLGPKGGTAKQAFRPSDGGPLVAKGQLVGLYSPDAPNVVCLLGTDFQPLELTPEEKAQARRRLEA